MPSKKPIPHDLLDEIAASFGITHPAKGDADRGREAESAEDNGPEYGESLEEGAGLINGYWDGTRWRPYEDD